MKVTNLVGGVILIATVGIFTCSAMAISNISPVKDIDQKGWVCTKTMQPYNLCIQKNRLIEKRKNSGHS